ncbi:uncharacterized protein BJ212DRAFT_1303018 [Suillus subaureus]|uniref:Uncharacterized protein n=1 Tax=Suillus subaureus TaxID=48587 RepID=A0A9P7E109_9AGAM|nr:uncharacterized protein BJ212DRAFT_1303018 [Suillus subaureus]KAG1808402.1 hypothetical protein BJ212DRAFT_1303018 [Suillus subaureus]
MAMTNSTSNSPCSLIDSAMLTDSQSFSISWILVDVAVSTEDTLPTEVSGGSCLSEEWKNLDGIPCIMGGMRALTASLGGMLHGRTSADFPWKTLPKELARLGYVLTNYPDDTLIPGELRPSLSRTKGIHDLSHHHCVNLVNHLKAGTLTIRAVKSDAACTHLTISKDPVIIGEAPSACSLHSMGGVHLLMVESTERVFLILVYLLLYLLLIVTPKLLWKSHDHLLVKLLEQFQNHLLCISGRPSSSEDNDMTGSANDEDESELQSSDIMKPFDTKPPLEPLEPPEYEVLCPPFFYPPFGSAIPGMKLNLLDYYSDPTNDQASSPPTYLPALSPAAMDSKYMQGGYAQEQFGGGQYKDPPTELTPSRLQSKIKPTSHNVVAGPSSQGVSANSLPPQGAVPMTHIIPPTPLKPFELLAPPSAETNSALKEGCAALDATVNDTAKNTNMLSYQVINLWMKSQGQVINSTNYWNLYTGYFKDWMHQELVRLGDGTPPQDGSMTPSTGVHCQCYELFKKSYPDTYQDILDTYRELNMLTDNQTILDGAATRQGFEATIIMCGNIVNEDASLGHVHTMPDAGGFFEKCC